MRNTRAVDCVVFRSRRRSGAILLELAIGALFLMTLLAMTTDISLMMVAYHVNERTCKEACRAAAQQRTASGALAAAGTAIAITRGDGNFVTDPILKTEKFVYQDYGGDPSAGEPYVSVTTEVTVNLPIPVFYFGENLSELLKSSWKFQKSYTYPIVDFNVSI